MKNIILAFLFIYFSKATAQTNFEKDFSSLQLTTLDQKTFSTNEIKNNTASVFVFLQADCPACESYSLTLNQLSEKFKSSFISFYGVFPGHYNTLEEMKEYRDRYHINFLLLTDPEKKLAVSLAAKITPEVFVVDKSGRTLYRGRIDDWMYAIGKKKPFISTHELRDALNAIVQHQPIKVPITKAIGCIIE